jgi:hypothetical protein
MYGRGPKALAPGQLDRYMLWDRRITLPKPAAKKPQPKPEAEGPHYAMIEGARESPPPRNVRGRKTGALRYPHPYVSSAVPTRVPPNLSSKRSTCFETPTACSFFPSNHFHLLPLPPCDPSATSASLQSCAATAGRTQHTTCASIRRPSAGAAQPPRLPAGAAVRKRGAQRRALLARACVRPRPPPHWTAPARVYAGPRLYSTAPEPAGSTAPVGRVRVRVRRRPRSSAPACACTPTHTPLDSTRTC